MPFRAYSDRSRTICSGLVYQGVVTSASGVGHALVNDRLHDPGDVVLAQAPEPVSGHIRDDRVDAAGQVRATGGGVVVGGVVEGVHGQSDRAVAVDVVAVALLQRAASEHRAGTDGEERVLLVTA